MLGVHGSLGNTDLNDTLDWRQGHQLPWFTQDQELLRTLDFQR